MVNPEVAGRLGGIRRFGVENARAVVFAPLVAREREIRFVAVLEEGCHCLEKNREEAWAMMLTTVRSLALAHRGEAHNLLLFMCVYFIMMLLF